MGSEKEFKKLQIFKPDSCYSELKCRTVFYPFPLYLLKASAICMHKPEAGMIAVIRCLFAQQIGLKKGGCLMNYCRLCNWWHYGSYTVSVLMAV